MEPQGGSEHAEEEGAQKRHDSHIQASYTQNMACYLLSCSTCSSAHRESTGHTYVDTDVQVILAPQVILAQVILALPDLYVVTATVVSMGPSEQQLRALQ